MQEPDSEASMILSRASTTVLTASHIAVMSVLPGKAISLQKKMWTVETGRRDVYLRSFPTDVAVAAAVSPLAASTQVSKPPSITTAVSTADAAPPRIAIPPSTSAGPPPTTVRPSGSPGVFERVMDV